MDFDKFLTSPRLSNDDAKFVSSANDMKLKISLDSQKSLVNVLRKSIKPCGTCSSLINNWVVVLLSI